MAEGYSPQEGGGIQRTDMHCHNCNKTFVAELDFDINGEHVVECPNCGHEHWRTIKDGKITEARWGKGGNDSKTASKGTVWKHNVLQAKTSTASAFLRERWLNRSDTQT